MTPEQIELEFEHMAYDAQLRKGGEVFEDDTYDEYDKETEEMDNVLSDMPTFGSEASDPYKGLEQQLPKSVEIHDYSDEWEDVEIDDFDEDD